MGNSIHKEIADLNRRYDFVVVDGAGRDAHEFRSALLVSDLLITPLRPSVADTDTIGTVAHIVDAVLTVNPRLKAFWIINHVRQQSAEARHEALVEAFTDLRTLKPLKTIITNLDAYPDALGFGLGVAEATKRKNRAADEMEAFYNEVKSWL
jgi:chromosome partitioning protein